MAVVVDASALIAVLLAEPEAGAVAERVSGHALISTSLLPYEVANAATAYDAGYLWLARETGADLVTLDAQLEKAWRKL